MAQKSRPRAVRVMMSRAARAAQAPTSKVEVGWGGGFEEGVGVVLMSCF